MATRVSSSLCDPFEVSHSSYTFGIHAARIGSQKTARMSSMYCGRKMLEIKLREVPMLSKCQGSSVQS